MGEEALRLLAAGLIGMGSGLLYDLIRPWRFTAGRMGAAAADLLFCLCAGAMQFIYAMKMPGGRMNIWALSLSLAGFLAYLHLLSPHILPILDRFRKQIALFNTEIKIIFKKGRNSAKNLFKKS